MCLDLSSHDKDVSFRSDKIDWLLHFPTGSVGTVVAINTDNDLQGRLMGLGLFVGARFRLIQGGNASRKPLLLAVSDTRIALGSELGRCILVEK
jgi:Fe2+ transport system protein FeoA